MTKKRIDVLLVELGHAPSRERAQALILAGKILVNDVPINKAGHSVDTEAVIRLRGQDHGYVSRGALKLKKAIEVFKPEIRGKIAADIGASTGGFTEVLLENGAALVHAIDVGHNQLDWKIRSDARVKVYEGVNARALEESQLGQKVDIVVVDVSFISLEKIFPAMIKISQDVAEMITLIKPQFEVGKDQVGKGGIVTSAEERQKCVERITSFAESLGLRREGLIESPITGTDGNVEFLAFWKRGLVANSKHE